MTPAKVRTGKVGRPRNMIARNRLEELRTRHKPRGLWLTTAEVATLTGISEDQVSRHEQHKRALTENHVMAYARVYKVPPHRLFVGLTASTP